MSRCQKVGRPILRSLNAGPGSAPCPIIIASPIGPFRRFSSTPCSRDVDAGPTDTTVTTSSSSSSSSSSTPPPPPPGPPSDPDWNRRKLDPNTTTLRWAEARLMRAGTPPIGSRRRRAAVRTSDNIPFEQLPYQCFQEARKVLNEDRKDKVAQIEAQVAKIRDLESADPASVKGGEQAKQRRLDSMRNRVEELKILADINDPLVKRRFENHMGDMSKPVYRHLADLRWRSMERKIIMQRIHQFSIVPDLLPKFEPTVDVKLFFGRTRISPGEILPSAATESPPALRIQAFDRGERLFSVAVVDGDVPNPDSDTFSRRCHYLAANIPWDPTKSTLPLGSVGSAASPDSGSGAGGSLAVPWLPPFSQKGAPYHRLSVFVFEQRRGAEPLDAARLAELYDGAGRDGFSVKSFRDKFGASPVGFTIFRTVWDDTTADVMARHGIPGADVEFVRPRVHSLKPPRKARGWEAKRQKPKYKFLWKYTKRIA